MSSFAPQQKPSEHASHIQTQSPLFPAFRPSALPLAVQQNARPLIRFDFANISLTAPKQSVASPAPVIQREVYGDAIKAEFDEGSPPEGSVAPEFYGGKFFGKRFEIGANFNPDRVQQEGNAYLTGEYRQYVRGFFRDGPTLVKHELNNGQMLNAEIFQEDGNKTSGRYGYRTKPDSSGKYEDKKDEGSRYKGSDIPSIQVGKGENVTISLEFRGQLIVTDEKSKPEGNVLRTREWSIKGKCKRDKKGNAIVQQLKTIGSLPETIPLFPSTPQVASNARLPKELKDGIEELSGLDMGDVQVHYSSTKPAQLQALAYAQGTDIYVAPGQEQHLPHEAWHVVQQKQGRVQPTLQAKGASINDDQTLEHEADVFGQKALASSIPSPRSHTTQSGPLQIVAQLAKIAELESSFSNEDQLKALAAGYSAWQQNKDIESDANPNTVLEKKLNEDLLSENRWKQLDIDDQLVGLIRQFPAFYIPTTSKIWKELFARIATSRGKLAVPAAKSIDLTSQKADTVVEQERQKAINRKLPVQNLTLTDEEQKLYENIMQASITINFPIDKLFKYTSPHILNAFELSDKTSIESNNITGNLNLERKKAEERLFDISTSEKLSQIRPRYAALNFKNHPTGSAARNDYGLSHLILSPELKKNSTITIGDSFDTTETGYGTVFPYTEIGIKALVKGIYSNNEFGENKSIIEAGIYSSSDNYLEVQVHQDIDIRHDVTQIMVSALELEIFQIDFNTAKQLIAALTGNASIAVNPSL